MGKRSSIDTDEYREERDLWYAKLAEEGFKDIEFIDRSHGGPGEYLRGVSTGDLRRNSRRIQNVRETLAYYQACRARVHDLPPGPERTVWSLYSEGFRKSEIKRMLSERGLRPADIERYVREGHEAVLYAQRFEEDTEGLE